jgi:hypothetical protein
MKDTFYTVSYKNAYIHFHYENGIERVHIQYPDFTFEWANTLTGAKRKITKHG